MPVSEREVLAPLWLEDLFPFPFLEAGALEEVLLWPLISNVCATATDPANSKQLNIIKVRLADILDPWREIPNTSNCNPL
jgi:hypothetical protein